MGYPAHDSDAPLRHFMARNRWMLRALLQLRYPEGIAVQAATDAQAISITTAYLQCLEVTLFDAALAQDNLLAFFHLVQKRGNQIELLEVKSKAIGSNNHDLLRGEFKPAVRDLAFKVLVLRKAFPQFEVASRLVFVDRTMLNPIEGLRGRFKAVPSAEDDRFMAVEIWGERDELLRASNLLRVLDADAAVETVLEEMAPEVEALADCINPVPTKLRHPLGIGPTGIGRHCFSCPFTATGPGHPTSGFAECWGQHASQMPHLAELKFGTNMEGLDALIANGEGSLLAVRPEHLLNKAGEPNQRVHEQLRQIRHTGLGRPWQHRRLPEILTQGKFPLKFVDFETITPAIPHHAGTVPYELLAYQWGCHTLEAPDAATPQHTDWLHTDDGFPNQLFAATLREDLGPHGTLLFFGLHEINVLKTLANRLSEQPFADKGLVRWLWDMVAGRTHHLVDLHHLAETRYFHPALGNRSSLKLLLPAVLNHAPTKRSLEWLRTFEPGLSLLAFDSSGGDVLNPYSLLPEPFSAEAPLPAGAEGYAEAIRQGAATLRLYEDLKYGPARFPGPLRDALQRALRRYNKLDTLALLLVWEQWTHAEALAPP